MGKLQSPPAVPSRAGKGVFDDERMARLRPPAPSPGSSPDAEWRWVGRGRPARGRGDSGVRRGRTRSRRSPGTEGSTSATRRPSPAPSRRCGRKSSSTAPRSTNVDAGRGPTRSNALDHQTRFGPRVPGAGAAPRPPARRWCNLRHRLSCFDGKGLGAFIPKSDPEPNPQSVYAAVQDARRVVRRRCAGAPTCSASRACSGAPPAARRRPGHRRRHSARRCSTADPRRCSRIARSARRSSSDAATPPTRQLIEGKRAGRRPNHCVNSGRCTWLELTQEAGPADGDHGDAVWPVRMKRRRP